MRIQLAALAALTLFCTEASRADGRDDTVGLNLASESYFGTSAAEIEGIRARGVVFEEVPVVLFVATRAKVRPEAVVELRLGGKSWLDITRALKLSPRIYYMEVEQARGPSHRVLGLYTSRPAEQWDAVEIDDAGVVDLVNLRFVTEHYGCEPERVVTMRTEGLDFVAIHREVRSEIQLDVRTEVGADDSLEAEYETDFYDESETYFGVTEVDVAQARQRQLPHTEMPVAFFIASRAHVEPAVVVDLRLRGLTWMEISHRWGLGPEVFYVPIETVSADLVSGPPYGNAYGHYKKRHRKDWNRIVLADADVINLVNLRFVSEHYGASAETVIRLRSEGTPFTAIYREATIQKKQGKGHSAHGKKDHPHKDDKGKSKESHGKSKGKGGKGKNGKDR